MILTEPRHFYRNVLGLEVIGKEPGRHVFFRAGEGVLLIFNPESTGKTGPFPSHGAKGPGHAALGISADSFGSWRRRLEEHGVEIEKEATWPKGGRSLYFQDPAGDPFATHVFLPRRPDRFSKGLTINSQETARPIRFPAWSVLFLINCLWTGLV
jgi:catechol 2,3-dioxygenase-like lactoylglutathione lyase family enzyme